jgi:hypothetical protein
MNTIKRMNIGKPYQEYKFINSLTYMGKKFHNRKSSGKNVYPRSHDHMITTKKLAYPEYQIKTHN